MATAKETCPGSGQRPIRTQYTGGGLWRCGHCGVNVNLTFDGKRYKHKRVKRDK